MKSLQVIHHTTGFMGLLSLCPICHVYILALLSTLHDNQIFYLSPVCPKCWFMPPFPVSMMFQSFTEGELQHVVGTLLDRKRRKSRRLGENQARRTKRARRQRPCAVRELELTVSELGLGYDSDETVLLRYCSGKCRAQRHNYDIIMDHMMQKGFEKKGRKDKVSNGPCCRPIAFENDFSFLDNKSRYHTIQNVSAKNCGCVWPRETNLLFLHAALSPCWKSWTRMLLKHKQKTVEYKFKERRRGWEYNHGRSVSAIFDRMTSDCHHSLGRHVLCGLHVKKKTGNDCSKHFYYLFYLCSNTVNCGVTTT